MSKKGVEKRHSETALFAALYRAVAYKDGKGPDYMAEYFLPAHFRFFVRFKKVRANVKRKSDKFTPGIYEYTLARTAFFDSVFVDGLKSDVPQIVLLGAGYDTRPYRFKELNDKTEIFELDIATTQERKKKCLKKSRIEIPGNVSLVSIDFNRESLKEVLEKAGYTDQKKTLFLWEGVAYYLEAESIDATLEFVNRFSSKESSIAFDYAVSISEETINDYYGVKEFVETWSKYRSNEIFRFTIDESRIGSFLEQRGLKIVDHMNNEKIEEAYLSAEDGSSTGRITGVFRFVLASIKSVE
jgi:methyltransferase (TIGR00027 family)